MENKDNTLIERITQLEKELFWVKLVLVVVTIGLVSVLFFESEFWRLFV